VKSIHEMVNQSPIMEFEGFVLRPFDGWHLWFEHPDGSGTTLRKDIFLGKLISLFKETM